MIYIKTSSISQKNQDFFHLMEKSYCYTAELQKQGQKTGGFSEKSVDISSDMVYNYYAENYGTVFHIKDGYTVFCSYTVHME